MSELKIFDSTLRDGSHAVRQKLSLEHIAEYCKAIDGSGLYTVIVGHGNGLGASSILMTQTEADEFDMLRIARKNLKTTRLGAFVTVGFGTVRDQIIPAINEGVDVFCIACHCTESDTLAKHIEYVTSHGHEAYGILMNAHLADSNRLLEEAKKIESYGANGIVFMDSAGAYTPERTEETIKKLRSELTIDVGMHPHNNLSLAVSNAYTAFKSGASIIDGTVRGFGAGAGNCQLEALLALLEKENVRTEVNLYQLLDAGSNVVEKLIGYQNGIDDISIISGYAGVVSTFKPQVVEAAQRYNLNPRDIFVELGKRGAISGQDDLILEVAQELVDRKE